MEINKRKKELEELLKANKDNSAKASGSILNKDVEGLNSTSTSSLSGRGGESGFNDDKNNQPSTTAKAKIDDIPFCSSNSVGESNISIKEKKYTCVELFDYTWYCLSPISQLRSYYLNGNVDNCADKISAWSMCMKGKFVTIPDLDNDIKEKLGFSHTSSSKVWPLKDKPGWY